MCSVLVAARSGWIPLACSDVVLQMDVLRGVFKVDLYSAWWLTVVTMEHEGK